MLNTVQALTGGVVVDTFFPSPAEMRKPRQTVVMQQTVSSPLPESAAKNFEQINKSVEAALNQLIAVAERSQTKVSFEVNDTTNRVVIRVENAQTGELIREVPPENLVKTAGVIFNGLA